MLDLVEVDANFRIKAVSVFDIGESAKCVVGEKVCFPFSLLLWASLATPATEVVTRLSFECFHK